MGVTLYSRQFDLLTVSRPRNRNEKGKRRLQVAADNE
jgi:hypothetical protein